MIRRFGPSVCSLPHHAGGFTLIELLIVTVLVEIVAAVAIPMVIGLTSEAGNVVADKNADLINRAVAQYHLEHGQYPRLATLEGQLVHYTNLVGEVSTVPNNSYRFGPYLEDIPAPGVGPNARDTSFLADGTFDRSGWFYDESTGIVTVNNLNHGDIVSAGRRPDQNQLPR